MSVGGNAAEDIALPAANAVRRPGADVLYLWSSAEAGPGAAGARHDRDAGARLGRRLTGKGTSRGIVRHRRDASGKVKEESVSLDDDVRDQDVIYVKESLF